MPDRQEMEKRVHKVSKALEMTGLPAQEAAHAFFVMISNNFGARLVEDGVPEEKIEKVYDQIVDVLEKAGTNLAEDICILTAILSEGIGALLDKQGGQ